MNIFITGANGYIGSHLARYLADQGHSIQALIRHQPAGGLLDHPHIQTTIITELKHARFSGAEVVIHAAGRAHKKSSRRDNQAQLYYYDNVDLSTQIAAQALHDGARRLIFISSIGAALLEKSLQQKRQDLQQAWHDSPYRASKLVAERELLSFALNKDNFDITILRLPMVYGPGAPGNFYTLTKALKKGIPLPFASIHNRRAFLALETLQDFIRLCLDHPHAAGCWALRDADEVATPDFIRALAEAGRYPPARLFPCPPQLLKLAGRLLGRSHTMDSLVDSLEVDISPAQKTLGWSPRQTVRQALMTALRA